MFKINGVIILKKQTISRNNNITLVVKYWIINSNIDLKKKKREIQRLNY